MVDLIDTHCHLTDLTPEELQVVVARAVAHGVRRLLCIGAGSGAAATFRAVRIAEQFPNIWASVGVHPHDASEAQDLDTFEALVAHPKVVAIGETGLDFYRDWAPFPLQRKLFENTLGIAANIKKPLIIHCRDAAGSKDAEAEIVSLLERFHPKLGGGVFHCYAGDIELAKRLEQINFSVSFPGTITFKNAHALRATLKHIPLHQILLETDSPYMAPEPFRGKPSEPMHVALIAAKVAEVLELPLVEVAQVTTKNAERLFRFEGCSSEGY